MTEGGAMSEERRIDPSTCSLCNTLALLSLVTMWTRIAEVTPQCSREITDVVDGYLKAVRSMDTFGCRLYTPSLTSYKQNCPNSTLTCFAEEVKVLMFEFEDDQAFQDPGLYKDLPKRLMSVIDKKTLEVTYENMGMEYAELGAKTNPPTLDVMIQNNAYSVRSMT